MTTGTREVEIVIVEDDPNDVELITRVFRKRNLANALVFLKDGAEALDYLFSEGRRAGGPNDAGLRVVVLDIKLPKVDGIEVLRRLKQDEQTREFPVVVLSASKEERDIKNARGLGANSYLAKPMRFDEFARAVSDLGLCWTLTARSPLGGG